MIRAHPPTTARDGALPDPFPLVGRDAALAAFDRLLDGPTETPRVVFVRGETGVGKTRLALEFIKRAAERGMTVAAGRAYPVEAGAPWSVFSDAWLPVLSGMEASALTVLTRGGDAELRYLFPALGSPLEEPADAAYADPHEFRTRLMWNFAEFVKRYASRTPILCVLEDMQWADDSSLELVHFLARQLQGHPVYLICTYDDQERDHLPQLTQTERSLATHALATLVVLESLDRAQVTELVCAVFDAAPATVEEFTAVLFGWTRGNPFFVEEILKSLVSSGALHREGDVWLGWDARDFKMPGSVRDAIMARLQPVAESTHSLAELAAVVGNRVSYPLLEAVSGQSGESVLTGLEELCASGVLEERTDRGDVVYDFRHPIVRRTIYAELGLQRVRVMHGAVAQAMETFFAEAADEHADELAFHFARSDGRALRDKATRYLVAAGRSALDRRADAEATNYLEAALERIPPGDPAFRDVRSDILPLLARAHTHMGRFAEAERMWRASIEALADTDPGYGACCRALGMTLVWRGEHDEAAVSFDAGLESARALGDRSGEVRLLVAKGYGLQEVGRGQDALATLEAALPLATELKDPALLARVHRALGLLHVWVGSPAEATEHARRAIELSRSVGDLGIEFWARWGLAVLEGMRGDTRAMARAMEEVNEIADRARSPVLRLWTADMAVELAFGRGDWDAGIAQGEQAIVVARALQQRTLLPRLLVWTSQFHVARGDLERSAALVEEAIEMSGLNQESEALDVHLVVPTYIGYSRYLVALGDYEDAIDAAEKGLQIAEGTGYILWAVHQLLPTLAEACLWAGHIDRAEEVGYRLRRHAERIDHRLGRAWADACDSLVCWKRGDSEGSVDLMRKAAEDLEAVPYIWAATRLRRQLAGRLLELGRREEALHELGIVHAVCARVRAGLELEKTRAMYREIGARPPPIAAEGGPLGLTPSEVAVAIRVAQGMSNKEIASELKCATRTASTHLSNIYTKLDIGGPGARVRLGNRVREAGLLD